MNRYVIDGIVQDLIEGHRIVYVAMRHHEAREAFGCLARRLESLPGVCVRSTWGVEEVSTPNTGGRITFHSAHGTGGRGVAADVLIVEDARHLDADTLADLMPAVNGTGGEVIYL